MKVDYIRVYAATTTNSRNETFIVGDEGRFLWQRNCDLLGNDFYKNSSQSVKDCGRTCYDVIECTKFSYRHGFCFLKNDTNVTDRHEASGGFCGYIHTRLKKDPPPINEEDVAKLWVIYGATAAVIVVLLLFIIIFGLNKYMVRYL